MRKYVIGFLAGAVFATAATAFADDIQSLIGREVQGEFPVTVQGKELEQKAIVIDGTSYAPVRAIGEAVGNKVDFDFEKGITLTKKEEPKVSPTPTPSQTPVPSQSPPITDDDIVLETSTLSQVNYKVRSLGMDIFRLKAQIAASSIPEEVEKAKQLLPLKEAELTKWEARKAELEN